jgi:hypothetical protein
LQHVHSRISRVHEVEHNGRAGVRALLLVSTALEVRPGSESPADLFLRLWSPVYINRTA